MRSKSLKGPKATKDRSNGQNSIKSSRKRAAKNGRTASKRVDSASPDTDDDSGDDVAESKFSNDRKDAKQTRSTRAKKRLEDEEEYQDDEEEPQRGGGKVYDSDALDEDSDFEDDANGKKRKRKSMARSSPKKGRSPKKKRKTEEEDEDDYEDDLPEGTEVVGKVVQAPKTGRVSPGQISQNTLDFLGDLKKPECNDRQWFKLHEPVYRQAEQEWKDFVEAFTESLIGVDPHIPHLPPKDFIHRIYRDIRFSNDKTPYKTNFWSTFSRSGRKGNFAGYHMYVTPYLFPPTTEVTSPLEPVQPGNESLIAAGIWCPARTELNTIRANIQRNSRRLRRIISSPEFVEHFGKAEPHPKGKQQNIFGQDGELKTAPKGVDKDHKSAFVVVPTIDVQSNNRSNFRDIDLLKCRSFCVVQRFKDSEALSPDFKNQLARVAKVMQPFVHCLNDMMTIMSADDEDDDNEEQGEEQADED
ncbi:hypothetical protein NLJ89_g4655 [Agrocybe chaxingu]|uniref:Uncharacterized protein n=1 Tax=Agrocybe chaxingu TaxID=84603 RepID=A0A9W8K2V0_9AGAR|nr:hypothetical protein NLJ89_g4655 [Agrocybe chaxingu]